MNLKLFYSPPWMAFIAPEKPRLLLHNAYGERRYKCDKANYEKAYAEAKANALEVVNWPIIDADDFGLRRLEPGEEYDWPGDVGIKDGKYILSV